MTPTFMGIVCLALIAAGAVLLFSHLNSKFNWFSSRVWRRLDQFGPPVTAKSFKWVDGRTRVRQ